MESNKDAIKEEKTKKVEEAKPKSTEQEWAQLMQEPDPLEDADIYAGERKKEESPAPSVDPEETELESDLGDVLKKSFVSAKDKSNFVQNIHLYVKI